MQLKFQQQQHQHQLEMQQVQRTMAQDTHKFQGDLFKSVTSLIAGGAAAQAAPPQDAALKDCPFKPCAFTAGTSEEMATHIKGTHV